MGPESLTKTNEGQINKPLFKAQLKTVRDDISPPVAQTTKRSIAMVGTLTKRLRTSTRHATISQVTLPAKHLTQLRASNN
jgi:hypothetical protein